MRFLWIVWFVICVRAVISNVREGGTWPDWLAALWAMAALTSALNVAGVTL